MSTPKTLPPIDEIYRVCENVAAVASHLNIDSLVPWCPGGSADAYEIAIRLGHTGEALHGELWRNGEREWIEDTLNACSRVEAYVARERALPTDYAQFWA